MLIEFIVLADRAEVLGGKLYLMGGGFDRVAVTQLPGAAKFDVAVSVLVDYHETNVQHLFEISCLDPDGGQVFEPMRGALEMGRPPGMSVGGAQRAMLVLQGPFTFPAAGEYSWAAKVDDGPTTRVGFRVEQLQVLAPMPPPHA